MKKASTSTSSSIVKVLKKFKKKIMRVTKSQKIILNDEVEVEKIVFTIVKKVRDLNRFKMMNI